MNRWARWTLGATGTLVILAACAVTAGQIVATQKLQRRLDIVEPNVAVFRFRDDLLRNHQDIVVTQCQAVRLKILDDHRQQRLPGQNHRKSAGREQLDLDGTVYWILGGVKHGRSTFQRSGCRVTFVPTDKDSLP